MEGEQRGGICLVPGGLGEDYRHQHIDQFLVLDNEGLIGDGFQQLRSMVQLVLHHAGDCCLDGMLGGYGLLPEGNEWRQTQLTGKREGHSVEIMRQARVQRHERSVLHDRFPVSIRLYRSTITLEMRDLQKRSGECEAGFHEHTRAPPRHYQSAPEPSAVDVPHNVGVLTCLLSQVVQCSCLAQRATWSDRHLDRDRVLHDAKETVREAYSRFIEK